MGCIKVRRGLFSFLQAFDGDEYLWIDQICIDQQALTERNHQVSFMSSIYSQCASVIMWLDSINAMVVNMLAKVDAKYNPELLAQLLDHYYFNRLWIVQEVLLAKHIRVLINHPSHGSVWISWDRMRDKANDIRDLPLEFKSDAFYNGLRFLEESGDNRFWSLDFCIFRFSEGKCFDPRDRIYGLMALVDESERLAIDYRKSTPDVFLEVVRSFCTKYIRKRKAQKSHYPVWLNDFASILVELSPRMGFSTSRRQSLECFLAALFGRQEIFHDKYTGKIRDSPAVTEMGFKEACLAWEIDPRQKGKSAESTFSLHEQISSSAHVDQLKDRWWFVFEGEVYQFCSAPALNSRRDIL